MNAEVRSNLLVENTSTIDESPIDLLDTTKMESLISDVLSACHAAIDTLNDIIIYDKIESGNLILERKYIYIMEYLIDWLTPFKMQVFTIYVTCHIYIQQL